MYFRWSKPHVASLGLSYTFHLRCVLAEGVMMLDLKVSIDRNCPESDSNHY